ncbi:MAG: transposase [Rhodomicrobiaceae bacterium]
MTAGNSPQGWNWDGVLARLGEYADLEQSAREFGAIKRTRVIKTAAQLLRLVLAYVLSGLSLRSTAAWAEAAGAASFSDVALLKRLKGCGPWLAELVGILSDALTPEAACGADGRRIVAVDATAICSPGGRNKRYRLLHTVYDVGAQRFRTTLVTERTVAERLDVGSIEKGEIRLGDRVYARYHPLSAVVAAGADYVVRLSTIALRLETAEGKRLNRAELCRKAESEGIQEARVKLCDTAGGEALDARVIAFALPPAKAAAARRLMRKNARSWGYTPSADAPIIAGCLMLITSLPADDWPAERVLALYRRRWQAELAFKRLKSLLDLEALRAFDSELVSAWIHAVLLVALLIDLERPSMAIEAPDSPRSMAGDDPSPYGDSSPSSLAA